MSAVKHELSALIRTLHIDLLKRSKGNLFNPIIIAIDSVEPFRFKEFYMIPSNRPDSIEGYAIVGDMPKQPLAIAHIAVREDGLIRSGPARLSPGQRIVTTCQMPGADWHITLMTKVFCLTAEGFFGSEMIYGGSIQMKSSLIEGIQAKATKALPS